MASVFDVAKYILQKKGEISTWKLQKLCYYSQAWSVAWTDEPIFDEEFEAWKNGPVCRALFNEHRGMYMINEDGIKGDASCLSEDQCETIDVVLDAYGDMAPYDLREQTHNEDPWINARARAHACEGANCEEIITIEDMGLYYGSL